MTELLFKTAAGTGGGGFCAEHDGYLCFIYPKGEGRWDWFVQSGGGWTHRGGENVTEHAKGFAYSTEDAERQMVAWLEANAD